jgi:hypothetical protein
MPLRAETRELTEHGRHDTSVVDIVAVTSRKVSPGDCRQKRHAAHVLESDEQHVLEWHEAAADDFRQQRVLLAEMSVESTGRQAGLRHDRIHARPRGASSTHDPRSALENASAGPAAMVGRIRHDQIITHVIN